MILRWKEKMDVTTAGTLDSHSKYLHDDELALWSYGPYGDREIPVPIA